MQVLRDAAFLLILILVVVTVRQAPADTASGTPTLDSRVADLAEASDAVAGHREASPDIEGAARFEVLSEELELPAMPARQPSGFFTVHSAIAAAPEALARIGEAVSVSVENAGDENTWVLLVDMGETVRVEVQTEGIHRAPSGHHPASVSDGPASCCEELARPTAESALLRAAC